MSETANTGTTQTSGTGTEGGGGGEGGQQQQQAAYYEAFKSDDLKTHPSIQRYKTVEDLAQAYVHAEKRIGGNPDHYLKLPEKADDAEGWKAFWQKLGAPDSPEGYKVDLKDASDADKAVVPDFLKAMHEAHVPPGIVEKVVGWWQGQLKTQQEGQLAEAQKATAAGEAALKAEWGGAFEQTKKEIGKLLTELGGKELQAELDAHAFGDSPALGMFLAKVAEKLREPGPSGDGQGADVGQRAMTPAQAKAQARELEAHPAFRDQRHAQHRDIVKLRNDALRAAEAKA